jgi:hypothetical protein
VLHGDSGQESVNTSRDVPLQNVLKPLDYSEIKYKLEVRQVLRLQEKEDVQRGDGEYY